MAQTTQSDVVLLDAFNLAAQEKFTEFPTVFNSPAVIASADYTDKVNGNATNKKITSYFYPDTKLTVEPQKEGQAGTPSKLSTSKYEVPVLSNRTSVDFTAFANSKNQLNPQETLEQRAIAALLRARTLNYEDYCRGALIGAVTGPLANAGQVVDISTTDASVGQSNLISYGSMIDSMAGFGNRMTLAEDDLACIIVHPKIKAALQKQDITAFQQVSIGSFRFTTYRGAMLLVDEKLAFDTEIKGESEDEDRVVTRYRSLLLQPGVLAYGMRNTTNAADDVARLATKVDPDAGTNLLLLTWFGALGIPGLNYKGTIAADSGAALADISNGANWEAVVNTKTIGIGAVISNG